MQPSESAAGNIHSLRSDLRQALGKGRVLDSGGASERYGASTSGVARRIGGAVSVRAVDEVQEVVRAAARYRVPLYPISTGHNWGYGTANPASDDCVIVDLSGMDKVVGLDEELGIVTVEPGVTQQGLRDYLDEHNLPFLVPVHGGGPTCSIVGNALERGYGITPYTDHFGAVTALEAVLANGERYRSALSELGGLEADRAFKWGTGPYLDGLFTQGNFGIVTNMTLALARTPQRVQVFFFRLASDADLEEAVVRVRQALRDLPGTLGGINLMNTRRMLSMMAPYPQELVGADGLITADGLAALAQRYRLPPWTGVGALYGPDKIVKAACATLKHTLRPVARRLLFVRPGFVRSVSAVFQSIPGARTSGIANYVATAARSMDIMQGQPSEVALPLAYWRSGVKPPDSRPLNPARDGCGLMWYAPLVPMKPDRVRAYVDMIDQVCSEHGIEPLITLTSLSARCFDSTVPILFDASSDTEKDRARACYEALFKSGQERGFVPYRAHVDLMPQIVRSDTVFWTTARQLKQAIDPLNIIAPGRYTRSD